MRVCWSGTPFTYFAGVSCCAALGRERKRLYTQNINTGRDLREFANPTLVVLHMKKLRPKEAKRLSTGHSKLGQS